MSKRTKYDRVKCPPFQICDKCGGKVDRIRRIDNNRVTEVLLTCRDCLAYYHFVNDLNYDKKYSDRLNLYIDEIDNVITLLDDKLDPNLSFYLREMENRTREIKAIIRSIKR
jgi:hypothetical protein